MNEDILKRLDEQDKKLDAIFKSSEKTRKYFMWTLIISVCAIVLPLVGLAFALPAFFSNLTLLEGL